MLGYLNTIEEKAIDELKKRLADILADKLYKIILYGSKARGDYDKESDIDLLVVVNNLDLATSEIISSIVYDIELEYEFVISVHDYSTQYYSDQLKNSMNLFINAVNKEGIAV
jgi:predicted nucleotidyltransferase